MYKMKNISRFIFLTILLCFWNSFASAKQMSRYGMFVYSNFCTSAESGDLYGNRITLRRLVDDDTLIYEYTDGNTHVVVADNLTFDPSSGKLSFEIHTQDGSTKVSGRFSNDGSKLIVKGNLFDEKETVTLNKTKDFAAPIQNCR